MTVDLMIMREMFTGLVSLSYVDQLKARHPTPKIGLYESFLGEDRLRLYAEG
jgi:hypothetical protein